MTLLEEILAHKAAEVQTRSAHQSLDQFVPSRDDIRDFASALAQPGLQVIAEVKQKSPSMGIIRQDLRPADIARMYQDNGAAAISVLTDNKYFGGELQHLQEVRDAVDLPVLRKDFIIDEYQIYESCHAGADALLLIADALAADQLEYLYQLSVSLGLHVLVESHGTGALNSMKRIQPRLAGLNSRDLQTMQVDLEGMLTKRYLLPDDSIHIAESGITGPDDLQRVAQAGFDAALIGTTLLRNGNPGENLQYFLAGICSTETSE
jgi:indole-3-glycerol phosphate synthase